MKRILIVSMTVLSSISRIPSNKKTDRIDYNLKLSIATEAGGMVVRKDVDITINGF